jgi:phage terminase large subunit GpA-like protein
MLRLVALKNRMISPLQIQSCKLVLKRSLRLLDPPPALLCWEWGELRRRMGRNVTAKPGRYTVATAPYQREPQESFTDKDVQTTVLYWGKRLGKTELINNLHGSTIEQNPRNILVVYPTLDSAKKWSKQFFTPMIRSTPALRDKIKDARSREANNTILSKEFPGGTISAIGSNSPSGFRQVQAPVVTADEIDAMEEGTEGDPITLAFGRAENYPDSIQVVSSTATRLFRAPEAGEETKKTTGSRIHDWWLKSDQRKWFVKNPCCGKSHVMAWSNVKWPDGHKHEDAWYECPDCGARWDDEFRLRAILSGEWRATNPFRGVRGYWLNGLNTTFSPKKGYKSKLHQFAAEFYDAYTSGEAARIAWKNTFLCEPHVDETEKINSAPLFDRCEDYSPETLPNEICIISLTVDVQGDRLEYEFIGMGEGEETWGIEYGKIIGDPEKDDIWSDLKQKTARTFKRIDGTEMKVDCVAIDHRFKGSRVRKFLKSCGHPRAYAVYGSSGKQTLLVIPHVNKHYKMRLYSVNTDAAKDAIFSRLRLTDHGARFMHFPKSHGYEKQNNCYFEQLTAEEVRVSYKRGFAERAYEKIGDRNEALDLRVYFLAAIDILRPNVKQIQENLKTKKAATQVDYKLKPAEENAEQPPAPVQSQTQRKPQRMPRSGGFIGKRKNWI